MIKTSRKVDIIPISLEYSFNLCLKVRDKLFALQHIMLIKELSHSHTHHKQTLHLHQKASMNIAEHLTSASMCFSAVLTIHHDHPIVATCLKPLFQSSQYNY